ncbi:MAG: hypothetical protein A2008_03040 [Candidatus Wallbacteria bacterium GWC2_49_35]|uniref:TraB determinant protein n=1 Tax=Candidatus Wallbacteria bacterium GWC2_49_35 TaxID=1817813 RepID=A0A1F7WVX4_9BACT|nr:MAG: hypothetical protein A2008_03040 [Candidatus Wallbacteria bacterium GWC2_49_35]
MDMNNDSRRSFYVDIGEYTGSDLLVKNNIYFLPSLHGRLEFAVTASLIMKGVEFDAVALELPDFMKHSYIDGVARLPYISAVCVETGGALCYHLIEPQDAMCEAARAFVPGRAGSLYFIDRFIDDYRDHGDSFPDPYSVRGAGFVNYCAEYYKANGAAPLNERGHDDLMREQFMAANLEALAQKHSKVLFVCGMYHYPAIFKMLDYKNTLPFYNKKVGRVYLANLAKSSHESVLSESPFIIKHFEAFKNAPPSADEPAVDSPVENIPQDNVLKVDFFSKNAGSFGTGTAPDAANDPGAKEDEERGSGCRGSAKDNISSVEYTLKVMQTEESFNFPEPASLDRARLNLKLLKLAAVDYHKNAGTEIGHNYFVVMLKFLSSYVKLKGALAPGLYDLLMAARASVDDNYAYEVFQRAVDYPWIDNSHKFVTLELGLNDLKIDGKLIRFHRRMKSVKQMFAPGLKKRKKEAKEGDWLREWKNNEDSICSYQPEDIVIENFGDYLRKKAKSLLNDEQARVEPFSTSLMDGVDMRETIRNYHVDKRIYVRVGRNAHGAAGTVVMIFDEDQPATAAAYEKYPYKMTWLGEHGQESDMAFYSSVPGDKIVGPGISRCEYGGFMLSYPPLRLYDIWRDPSYFMAKTKSETLLLAALDYSIEKFVVYCAKKPPRTFFKTVAARLGKKIVYVPLGQFSRITLDKLRVMHILSAKSVRDNAKDYIW